MRLLLESNKHLVCATDDDGWTPFHFAADNNQCYAIESLLKVNKYTAYLSDQKYKKTALHVAAYKGYHNVIEKLLKYLPDMWESVDGNGQNILHIAVRQFKKPLLKFILSKTRKFDTMNALIIQRDHEGNTPLHLVAKFGYNVPEMRQWLKKTDHFIVDNTNSTPSEVVYNQNFYQVTMDEVCSLLPGMGKNDEYLVYLVFSSPFSTQVHWHSMAWLPLDFPNFSVHSVLGCMRLLVERNEDLINVADHDGWTAFHFAADNNRCYSIGYLLGVNRYLAYLPDQKYKKTALHIAAYKGYHKVVEKLLEYLPDMWESVDGNGQNILHIAVQQYKKPLLKFILSKTRKFDTLNTLIIQRDQEGNTPLHLASKLGYDVHEMREWLQKIDHYTVDNTNLTPSEVIFQNFTWDVMDEGVVGIDATRDEIYGFWKLWTQGRALAMLGESVDGNDQFILHIAARPIIRDQFDFVGIGKV
ncbi:hypothetical protein ACET3Z_004196 [Daucus carota]